MKYMLLIYSNEAVGKAIPKADMDKMMPAYAAYTEAMANAGVLNGGNRLQWTDTATTVRTVDGRTQVLDGPYAETKEQMGGFWVIEAEDFDAALEWARKATLACEGPVELRPFQGA